MCVQCMAGAMTAVTGASGLRAWLATRTWITPRRLRHATRALLVAALMTSTLLVTGSTAAPAQPAIRAAR